MTTNVLIAAICIMALVTYLPRVVPLVLFRKKIQNSFLRSFLLYMPYGILAAMIFPAIFFSTDSLISAIAGAVVSLLLAWNRRGLLTVAVGGTLTVYIVQWILTLCA